MVNGAAFHTSGIGFNFDMASSGPTVVMPVFALGTISEYGEPGDVGKVLCDELSDQYFEGSLGDPGERPVFGTSFKAGTERDTIAFTESAFAVHIDPLTVRLRKLKRNTGRSEEELKRSAFAYVLGHLESMALEAACSVLKAHDFIPTSLIYDGCLVTHNSNGNLNAALREAETAVASTLGFGGLTLKEKDMFYLAQFSIAHSSRDAARQAALDAASVDMATEGEANTFNV